MSMLNITQIIKNELKIFSEQRKFWTDEEIRNVALKYTTKKEFYKNNLDAYSAAQRRGILDDVTSHMPKDLHILWDEKSIRDEFKKYSSRSEFKKEAHGAWSAAKRLGILDDLYKTMPSKIKKWTKKDVEDEIIKYKTVKDFIENSQSAYAAAINHGWWEELSKNLQRQITEKGYWNLGSIMKEALKYSSRSEFKQKSPQAYSAASDRKILPKVTKHMKYLGNLYKRMVYAWEFSDNNVYIGLTLNQNRRQNDHFSSENSPVYKHIQKTGLIPDFKMISDKYIDSEDAQNLENCAVEKYKQDGWTVLNSAKTGGLGACKVMWTYDAIKSEIKKYEWVSDFNKYSGSAAAAAQRNGWYNELTKHLKRKIEHGKWNNSESIYKEAKKYNRKVDFMRGSPGAYTKAKKLGIFDDVTKHMIKFYKIWTFDDLKNEVSKYKTKSEFRKNEPKGYDWVIRHQWMKLLEPYFKK